MTMPFSRRTGHVTGLQLGDRRRPGESTDGSFPRGEEDSESRHIPRITLGEELVGDTGDGTDGAFLLERNLHRDRPSAQPVACDVRSYRSAKLSMHRVGHPDLPGDPDALSLLQTSAEEQKRGDSEKRNHGYRNTDRDLAEGHQLHGTPHRRGSAPWPG